MESSLKARIITTHAVECKGIPTYRGQVNPTSVNALLTTRADGTVDVQCVHYNAYNEGDRYTEAKTDKGTCRASDHGNLNCVYRKLRPDTQE